MKQRLNFIAGITMFALASTLAFTISRRSPPGPPASAAAEERHSEVHKRDRLPGKTSSLTNTPRQSRQSLSLPADPISDLRELSVSVDPAHPRSAELAGPALQIERHALARLDKLTAVLDLTIDQQRRIFPVLVRGSQSFDPAMSVVAGGLGGDYKGVLTPDERQNLIQNELRPEQQDQLVEHSLTDLMLWEEIIGQLTRLLDQQTTVTPTAGAARLAPEPPEDPAPLPASRGGRNLFD